MYKRIAPNIKVKIYPVEKKKRIKELGQKV